MIDNDESLLGDVTTSESDSESNETENDEQNDIENGEDGNYDINIINASKQKIIFFKVKM